MKCPNCSFESVVGSKFCENCGQPFERACPNCGKSVSSNAKFCRNCGFDLATAPDSSQARLTDLQQSAPRALQEKILSSRAQIEGERKLVTVLFTDIVGSTAFAEKLDPEHWGEIVSGAHSRVTEATFRYEGTIAQLLGDGVLAFFGAPIAHEDDPVRALNAALDIRKAIEAYAHELAAQHRLDNFQMRVGLNTGLVVVGNIGSDLHMEYLAVGDTVNLAARIQSAAEPNTIFVSANTARLVKHTFDLESRGAVQVKGKAEPVPVFRVVMRKAIPEPARGLEGLHSPLVGRERETQMLQAAVEGLKRGGGRIVSVMGEAGLGKSRLVAELRKALADDGPPTTEAHSVSGHPSSVQWYEGRSLSYETSMPYTPFVALFNKFFDLQPEETDDEKYVKVKSKIDQAMAQRGVEIAPFIATMLGIKLAGEDLERVKYLEPPQLRERVFNAMLVLFEAMAKNPLVLVFEDLHWADSTSLDMLERLMPLTERASLLILALFRPQRQEPSWRFHELAGRDYAHRYTAMTLEPLDEKNSRALVGNLLYIEDLPAKVRALILQKAEGNPFFVEEVIRSLLDAKLVVRDNSHWRATREIEKITVPDTLVGVISARLDRLDEESKRVAQTAAVIGREFQFDILENVYGGRDHLDQALGNLQRRELVREKSRVPLLVYLFKHALTQETAHASLLLSKRRDLHRRVAEYMEQNDPERVTDIALHYLEAQDQARALPYLVEAGSRSARAYSTPEAIRHFAQAIEILQKVENPQLARRAYEGLGGALMLSNDVPRAVEHFQVMNQFGQAHGDIPMQVSSLNKLGLIEGQWLGQFERAEQRLLEAERLGRAYQDQAGLAEMYTVRCGICNMMGDFHNAARYLGESVEIGRALNVREQMAFGLAHTANTLTYMVRFDEAWAKAQEALQVSEEIGNQMRMAETKVFPIPFYHLHKGDVDRARQSAEEGTQIAHKIGLAFVEGIGLVTQAEIARMRGEYENALGLYTRAQEASRVSGQPYLDAGILAAIGSIYLEINQKFEDKTIELHAQALKMMEHPMAAAGGAGAFADMGFCALRVGKVETAIQMFEAGLTRPTILGLLEKPRLLVGQALIALGRHQVNDASKLLQDARQYAEKRAMKYLYPFFALTDAQISTVRGDNERAAEQFARAEALASEMKMRPTIWQACAGAAKILSTLGRAKEAEEKRNRARAMIAEIAGLLQDEKLREMFIENATGKLTKESK